MKKLLKKLQWSIVCFAVLAVALAAVSVRQAEAAPSCQANEVEMFFYADAAKTVQVGYKFLGCDGTRIREGTIGTPYYTQIVIPCDCSSWPDDPWWWVEH